jgi:hypothetical protein
MLQRQNTGVDKYNLSMNYCITSYITFQISETDWLHAVILEHKVWPTGNTITNKLITDH